MGSPLSRIFRELFELRIPPLESASELAPLICEHFELDWWVWILGSLECLLWEEKAECERQHVCQSSGLYLSQALASGSDRWHLAELASNSALECF